MSAETDDDIDAAAGIVADHTNLHVPANDAMAKDIAQAIQSARLQGYREGMEAAAKIASKHMTPQFRGQLTGYTNNEGLKVSAAIRAAQPQGENTR